MIRRRTSEAGGGVLSFTFLDVLTCTMGSLVLLLVVLAQKATNVTLEEALANAAKPAATAAEKPKPPVLDGEKAEAEVPSPAALAELKKLAGEDPNGDAKIKLDEKLLKADDGLTAEEYAKRFAEIQEHKQKVEKMRVDAAQRIKDDEARVSHLEEHERRLEQEIAKLRVALERLEEAEKKQSVDQEAAKAELERLKTLVAETIKQIEELRKETTGKKSYAIVPYKGLNGTMRRPIYIECTKDAVTIYPEGIKLVAADFDGPLRSGNPLNAAIRAAREELNARARAAGQTDLPDPYPLLIVRPDGAYAYGAAMSAISSWDSDFGYEFVDADWKLEYPDPDPRLDQMMRHAVEQARQRQAMLAKAAPRRYGPRLAVGGGEGDGIGGGDDDGAGGGFEGVVHPGGDGDRIGDHNGENWIAASAGGGAAGNGVGMGSEAGTGTEDGQAGANRYASGGLSTDGQGTSGGGVGGSGGLGASGSASDPANGNMAQGTPAGTVAGGTGPGQPGAAATQAGQAGQKGAGAGAAGGQVAGAGSQSGQGAPGGTQATGSTEQTGGSTFAGAKSPTGDASSQTTAAGGSPGSSGGAAGSAASAAAGGQTGGASSSAGGDGASGGVVSYNVGQTASAATSRGANWANEAASRRASAISRPIRVVVKPEAIDVMPTNQGGSGPVGDPTTVSFHQPTDRVLDQLAAAVKERMNEWGLAGNNMYWRPTLVLQVAPGAEKHAARLNDLLRDSGIDVKFQEVASRPEEGAGSGTTR
ncbi:MAG: hypothetical protein JNL18_21875 [Planctomycetaceae bacterium]|nr:hypothetical protein [Planctomycetaceae bacterium]